jgi:hypothetical protein
MDTSTDDRPLVDEEVLAGFGFKNANCDRKRLPEDQKG